MRHLTFFLIAFLSISASGAQAATFTLSAIERGCLIPDLGTLCGGSQTPDGTFATGEAELEEEARSYFLFDLSAVLGSVVSAELYIELTPSSPSFQGYVSPDANEAVGFYDLGASTINDLLNGPILVSTFNNLQTPDLLGFATLSLFDYGAGFFSQSLGSSWIDALNAANGGLFGVGGVLISASSNGFQELVFGGSSGDRFELRIVTDAPAMVPLPGGMVFVFTALFAILGLRRWGKSNFVS